MNEYQANPLLGFLMTRFRAVGDSFRTNPRRPSRAPGRLSWRGQSGPCQVLVRFIDISRAGAAVLSKVPVPRGVMVRLCLVTNGDAPWMEADVLSSEIRDDGKYRVRLIFRDPCPTVFLKSAVLDSASSSLERAESQEVSGGSLEN